tara:strand:- start:153 stop:449 length:297 start_codon:yes stop_codon:yes gene_type:complete
MNDRVIRIGEILSDALDFPYEIREEALDLFEAIALHPNWRNQRSNRGLMVDCVYEIAKKHQWRVDEKKVTIWTMIELTKDKFGTGTQPKPHIWREHFG